MTAKLRKVLSFSYSSHSEAMKIRNPKLEIRNKLRKKISRAKPVPSINSGQALSEVEGTPSTQRKFFF